jgi:Bacterial SH3 domain
MESVVIAECASCARAERAAALGENEVVEALRRALAAAVDEAAGRAIAAALARLGGAEAAPEVREWLLARIPIAGSAGDLVALLGRLPDPIARAEATRIATENFRERQLPGRWDVVLAGLETPAARAVLIQALLCGEEAIVWAAAQAMLSEWAEVPSVAFPALRERLRCETAPEPVRFCAAVLLARGGDTETWPEALPWLMAALEAETEADTMVEPALGAIVLLRRGDGEVRARAQAFLRARLAKAADAVLEHALPPLLETPTAALVEALVAACQQRRVTSPSAERLAAAFASLRGGARVERALAALLAALGPAATCAAPREATLIAALGHLGHPGALPWLAARATATDDPALQAAVLAAQARLGVPAAVDRLTACLLEEASDAVEALSPDAGRGHAAAAVLGSLATPGLVPGAIDALARALANPHRAAHAARALERLNAHRAPLALRALAETAAPGAAVSADLDRTREWSLVAEENRTRQWAAPNDPERTQAWNAGDRPAGEEPHWAAAAMRRPRLFVPMGLQRFTGVAWALVTCAVIGMGYMRWLVAQPPPRAQPRVLATVIVMRPGAEIHSRKGVEHPVIKSARRGDYLSVVDKTTRWWKVRFPGGQTGWIERRDTAVVVPGTEATPPPAVLRPAIYAPASAVSGEVR